jgi:DeoR/GlpR family transcriptional regulator of sugar metabolism
VHGEVSIADLAGRLDVSEMTIRRDLGELETRGLARRVAGGAIYVGDSAKRDEPPFGARALTEAPAKSHIATRVADLIRRGDVVYFDGGSTILAVARATKGRGLGLTVVTTSLLVALEMADEPNTDVIVLGGVLRPGELTVIGQTAERHLDAYNVDICLLGVGGVDPDRGLSDYHLGEAQLKAIAAGRADRVVAVVDRTKLGRVLLRKVADVAAIHVLVTDAPEADPQVARLRERGVDVITVRAPSEEKIF